MNTGSWSSDLGVQTFRVFNDTGKQVTELVLGTDIRAGDPKILRQVAGIIRDYDIKNIATNFPPARILFNMVCKILQQEYNITDVTLDAPTPTQHEEHNEEVIENDVV